MVLSFPSNQWLGQWDIRSFSLGEKSIQLTQEKALSPHSQHSSLSIHTPPKQKYRVKPTKCHVFPSSVWLETVGRTTNSLTFIALNYGALLVVSCRGLFYSHFALWLSEAEVEDCGGGGKNTQWERRKRDAPPIVCLGLCEHSWTTLATPWCGASNLCHVT